MNSRGRIVSLAVLSLLAASGWAFVAVGGGVDMTTAARQFVELLGDEQRQKVLLAYDAAERTDWHFIPKDYRKGLQIKDMTKPQREAAHGLLRSCLSEVGYDKATKIMQLEQILHELEKGTGGRNIRDTERYYFTLFGEPTEKSRWGLSIEGHHLSLNFVVDDGAVVASTPAFFAANPATVKNEVAGGQPVGTRVLRKEEQLAFDLVNSLDDQQRSRAIIADKAPREIRAAGEPQPPDEKPAGIPVAELRREQRGSVRDLVTTYLENLPDQVRESEFDEIRAAGPTNIHFAWAGATRPGVGHYYRIQGPTFLIEFVNTQPDPAGNPANHIHCVYRAMKGDFAIEK